MRAVEETRQERLSADGCLTGRGAFEVLAITAGEGNGWQFGEQVLRESVKLWNGAECFIDHAEPGARQAEHSVRDLAGVLHRAEWDDARKGVRCRLRTLGPSGPLLEELGRQIVLMEGECPRVGFSADVVFITLGKQVQKIVRVLSVDLVYNPARGGLFLRALNAVSGRAPVMRRIVSDTGQNKARVSGLAEIVEIKQKNQGGTEMKNVDEGIQEAASAQLQQDVDAVRKLLDGQKEQTRLEQEAETVRAVREEVCGFMLESGLAAARLPQAAAENIRARFAGKVFRPKELSDAIDQARKLVSDLTSRQVVQGPGRVQAMVSSEERLQAAVDDLFGAPRDKGLEGVQVERLQGIRELYMSLTGDYDLHGGFYRDRAQLAFTVDFSGLVVNAMNKVINARWLEMGRAGYDWWKKVTVVEHMGSLNDVTGILVGTIGALPAVAEGAEYTELPVGDSPETGSFTKYGGYIPLTLELIDRDQTRVLREYPRALASAGLRMISSLVAGIFTANSGAGPTMADGGALFNATAVTTAGGHANLLTTALSGAAWETACAAVYDQPMLVKNEAGLYGSGDKLAINPRFLLVPRALQLTARKILYPSLENAANIYSENQQQGAPGDVVTVPEWTDTTNWAAACDPAIAPAIHVCERFGIMPEIFIAGRETDAAVFMNDEHRIKVRHFLALVVSDYRPLHKSNVAG